MVLVYDMIHFCLFYSTFGRVEDALESHLVCGWLTHFAQVAPLQRVADKRVTEVSTSTPVGFSSSMESTNWKSQFSHPSKSLDL